MKEYALIFKVAATGNNTITGHNCPMQFSARLVDFSLDSDIDSMLSNSPLTLNMNIKPDESILPCSSVYTGIFQDKSDAVDLKEALSKIYRLISSVSNKNIYIVGWNVLEDTLDIINASLERVLKANKLNVDRYKLIDIQELSELSIPVENIGSYGIDTLLLYLANKISKDGEKQLRHYRDFRWNENYCSEYVKEVLQVLMLSMHNLNFKTLKDAVKYLNTPKMLDTIAFGKHKGKKLSDLYKSDNEYLCWLHSCKEIMDKNPNLKYTLDNMFSI